MYTTQPHVGLPFNNPDNLYLNSLVTALLLFLVNNEAISTDSAGIANKTRTYCINTPPKPHVRLPLNNPDNLYLNSLGTALLLYLVNNEAISRASNTSTIYHPKLERWLRSGIDTIKYHTWPRIPQGKVTKTQTSQTRANRSALSQQVTTRQQWTDAKAWQTQDKTNTNDPQKKNRLGKVSKIFYRRA